MSTASATTPGAATPVATTAPVAPTSRNAGKVALGALTPGDLAELIGAFNDVTAKLQKSHDKLQGEVARLRRELSEANAQVERSRRLAALGEMAAGISHEIRNPLGSIRLYARMLDEDLADRPGERETARKIARAVGSLDAIVGDVLAFSREFRLQVGAVEVGSLFERAMEQCDPMSHASWRGVRVERPGDEELVASVDAGLLTQAMVNVVRNALQAMQEREAPMGGHVLRLTAMRGVLAQGGAAVVIGVSDTGPGVTPEVVARMFNPFFTTRSTGTGLGLAIVHRIVDAHGGEVRVRNVEEAGRSGAVFELVVPGEEKGKKAGRSRAGRL